MQRIVEKFCTSYFASLCQNVIYDNENHRLRELEERWRQDNRRGHGHYAKKPEPTVMSNLRYSIVKPPESVNSDLIFPQLSISPWLDVTIGLLLSITAIRETIESFSESTNDLFSHVVSFLKKWTTALKSRKRSRTINSCLENLSATTFEIQENIPIESDDLIAFILRNFILPLANASMPVMKLYTCVSCKRTYRVFADLSHILINAVNGQLSIQQQLKNYFRGALSDKLCDSCSGAMNREIQLLHCK